MVHNSGGASGNGATGGRRWDTSKVLHQGRNRYLSFGSATMTGRRLRNEDAHLAFIAPRFGAVGVFDGHFGHECAHFASRFIAKALEHRLRKHERAKGEVDEEPPIGATITADEISRLMHATDAACLANEATRDSGSTAALLIVEPAPHAPASSTYLTVAHLGDSRVVLGSRPTRELIAATKDHSPTEPRELRRIQSCSGGSVCERTSRINGSLQVARAFGNVAFKQDASQPPESQMVIAVPEVAHFVVDRRANAQGGDAGPQITFVVLCCDGIIEGFKTDEALLDFVVRRWGDLEAAQKTDRSPEKPSVDASAFLDDGLASPLTVAYKRDILSQLAAETCQEAFNRGSTDNLSCVIVDLMHTAATTTPESGDDDTEVSCDVDGDGGEDYGEVAVGLPPYVDPAPLPPDADPHYIESLRHLSEDVGATPLPEVLRRRHKYLLARGAQRTEAEERELHGVFGLVDDSAAAGGGGSGGHLVCPSRAVVPGATSTRCEGGYYDRVLSEWGVAAQKSQELQLDMPFDVDEGNSSGAAQQPQPPPVVLLPSVAEVAAPSTAAVARRERQRPPSLFTAIDRDAAANAAAASSASSSSCLPRSNTDLEDVD